jgi:hypothetical protein
MTRLIAALALCAALVVAVPGAAWAAADPDLIADRPTAESIAEESAFATWEYAVAPTIMAEANRYLSTSTCPQERSYWCGPAAVQTALTCFRLKPSQTTIAAALGTTTGGSPMTLVDDVLRAYSGKGYTYRSASSSGDFADRVLYSVYSQGRPLIVDVRIKAGWGPYRKDHAGHIIALDGMDWRYGTVRVNDSYDEHAWQIGGGYTGGHTTYTRSQMWSAVSLHPGHPIVY